MDAKTKSIIAHLTIIGWIAALVINNERKDEYTNFYLRQTLGIYLFGIVFSWIPILNIFSWLLCFAVWLLSLVYSTQGEMKLIPFGEYFQDWFRGL